MPSTTIIKRKKEKDIAVTSQAMMGQRALRFSFSI
jgi:hypothetical protein